MGRRLIGLQALPLIGNGEVRWLAEVLHKPAGEVRKPGALHALAAILTAGGWPLKRALAYLAQGMAEQVENDLGFLDGSTVTVFEDTIAGIVALRKAADLLQQRGIGLQVRKVGIGQDVARCPL
jgi:hypothetical protein